MTAYAELQVTTNFSFLRGASHAEELAAAAAELGHAAIAVTDRNTLAGRGARARGCQGGRSPVSSSGPVSIFRTV